MVSAWCELVGRRPGKKVVNRRVGESESGSTPAQELIAGPIIPVSNSHSPPTEASTPNKKHGNAENNNQGGSPHADEGRGVQHPILKSTDKINNTTSLEHIDSTGASPVLNESADPHVNKSDNKADHNNKAENTPDLSENQNVSSISIMSDSSELTNNNNNVSSSNSHHSNNTSTNSSSSRSSPVSMSSSDGSQSEPASPDQEDTVRPTENYSDVLRHEGPWLDDPATRKKKRYAERKMLRERDEMSPRHKSLHEYALKGLYANTRQSQQHSPRGPHGRILKGRPRAIGVEIYLNNIGCEDSETDDNIITAVRSYAKQKDNIRIMAARVIHNKVCQDIVGCKMTVPEAQVNKVLEPTFWPKHMECRRWEKNKVSRRQAVRWRDHNDNERQYEQYHTREATHNDQREYRDYDADYHSYHRDHHDWRDSNETIMNIIIIIDMKTMITIIEPTRVKTMQEKMLGEKLAIHLCK